ncbi:hypothetical protein BD324DRAFT_653600 [Kockovaella imperatae]|uniref:Uncharacterized protein n=1 Tax=Kockovaella imperatae TaxID=4999 RepID=A0A1Y1U795_9TREE|nr:hypothetical protein BD324DRAFT_653600 [Kockovaella imperatae]ORX33901.1 hypothetical protein BD324DRAFT_653600 [Kockovaella imperatae]
MEDEVDWGAIDNTETDEWRRGGVQAGAEDEDVMSLDGAEEEAQAPASSPKPKEASSIPTGPSKPAPPTGPRKTSDVPNEQRSAGNGSSAHPPSAAPRGPKHESSHLTRAASSSSSSIITGQPPSSTPTGPRRRDSRDRTQLVTRGSENQSQSQASRVLGLRLFLA